MGRRAPLDPTSHETITARGAGTGRSGMTDCLYKILGVSIEASQQEIKAAFRRLAMRWHPDLNPQQPDARERFQCIREAYERLADPARRREYDERRGHGTRRGHARNGGGNGNGAVWSEGSSGFPDEFFESYFGFPRRRPAPCRSVDLRFDLQMPSGNGREGPETICYERVVFCRVCAGAGRKTRGECVACGGRGLVTERRSVSVWIPSTGVHGMRLRIPGAGDHLSPTVPAGDLVLFLQEVDV